MGQNIIYSPSWDGTKGPWLRLMTKPLLFSFVELLSSVSAFSHFSDYSLAKVCPQTEGKWRRWWANTIGSCLISTPLSFPFLYKPISSYFTALMKSFSYVSHHIYPCWARHWPQALFKTPTTFFHHRLPVQKSAVPHMRPFHFSWSLHRFCNPYRSYWLHISCEPQLPTPWFSWALTTACLDHCCSFIIGKGFLPDYLSTRSSLKIWSHHPMT